jgi:APA family basic amino acid/polyamine antiporter
LSASRYTAQVPTIPKETESHGDLPRRLGLLDATTIVIGTTIGGGIFLVPSIIARDMPSVPMMLAVWVIAGIASFFGALAYAELGAMLPHSGGQYVYLKEAYGPLPAFLTGWIFFLVIHSGSIAAVTVACSRFLAYLLPDVPGLGQWFPPLLIMTLTAVNYIGVRAGARVQLIFTTLKLSGLFLLVGSAALYRGPSELTWRMPDQISSPALAAAMLGAFLAYDGWHVIAFVAGEVTNPKRNITLSLIIGVGAVMAIYLIANVAYFHVLPLDRIIASGRVAADAAERTMGPVGAAVVTLTIVFSTIGAANGAIMTAPRMYFAQARDGLFFRQFAEVHPRFLTPSASILAQGIWTSLLTTTGSYETLISYAMFIAWMVHAAAVLGLMVLRRKHPEWERPYRVWGYPWAPLLFGVFALWFVVTTLIARPVSSLAGCAILLAGIPVYYAAMRWKSRHTV